jgi:hypothetical protein
MPANRAMLGVILAAATCGFAFAQQAPFTMSVKALHGKQSPRDVVIAITIANSSDGMLCVPHFIPVLDYTFDVQNANGHPALETPLMYKIKHPEPSPLTWVNPGGGCVRSGGSTGRDITISDYYDLTQPGSYTIQVSRRLETVSPDWVRSNTVTIMVDEEGWRQLPN